MGLDRLLIDGRDKLREYAKGCFVEKVSCLVDLVDSKLNPILNSENMPWSAYLEILQNK